MLLRKLFVVGAALALALSMFGETIPAAGSASAGCAGPSGGGDWPSYGHDLRNTRHQPAEKKIGTDNVTGLAPAWAFSIASSEGSGNFQSTPVEANGCLYVGTTTGQVFALNADTGKVVWSAQAKGGAGSGGIAAGGIFALTVDRDRVIGFSGLAGKPFAFALDADTGANLWDTPALYKDPGATINASPVVWNGLVFAGTWGTDGDPKSHPPFLIIDERTGAILKKTFVIPRGQWKKYAGGGIWGTGVVDTNNGYLYVGTSNPYSKRHEHRYTNALIKVDMNRHHKRFGEIVDAYKGNVDQYFPGIDRQPACKALGDSQDSGYSTYCFQLDIDFGASPNLTRGPHNQWIVDDLQKSGVFHAAYADNMEQAWTTPVSGPILLGNAATSSINGHMIVGTSTPGQAYALDARSGEYLWVTPFGDATRYQPMTTANGLAYTDDTKGNLDIFDVKTGVPMLVRSMAADVGGDACDNLAGGVAIARNTVYSTCDTGETGGGWIIAYRLGG